MGVYLLTLLPNWLIRWRWHLALGVSLAVCLGVGLETIVLARHNNQLHAQVIKLQGQYSQALYTNHLTLLDEKKTEQDKAQLAKAFDTFKSDPSKQRQATVENLFNQYNAVQAKIQRNAAAKLDTTPVTNQYGDWGTKLLNQQFDALNQSLTAASQSLDTQYQQYQASLITPTPQVTPKPPPAPPYGYFSLTVATSRGSFHVYLVKMRLSEVTVKTVSANTTDCATNCPAQTLAQFVAQNGGYAGINGSYFCPPDYASCDSSRNSFDFALYNTNLGNWINQSARGWDTVGLATFSGHSAAFFRTGDTYDGRPVTAAISNFPPLLMQSGQITTDDSQQDASQQQKSTRGALGVDGTYIYLAQITNANLTDAAYAMQALGARDVLNLDGGGSSALYIGGSYMLGPGRLLPNAVVLVRN